jgi:lipopolysaccharide/colanic/teichoic acid biosynthesis glycosyltransferase
MAQSAAAVILRRGFDVLLATLLILLALPLLSLIVLALLLLDRGPVLYRQQRLGLNEQPFTLYKFRTLKVDTPGNVVIPDDDVHITLPGRVLRRYRLDELPQLFNVLIGDMALVGPRPEIALDLAGLDPTLRNRFLALKPGITGPVQLEFIAEDELLAEFTDPTRVYREQLIPAKVAANLGAYQKRSISGDLICLLNTVVVLFSRRARAQSRQRLTGILPERSYSRRL